MNLYQMAPDDHQADTSDYVMSETFVSETRPRPYRKGFHSRRYPRRPSLKQLLSLHDGEFDRYLRNGCRMPDACTDILDLVGELRDELVQLRSEVMALQSVVGRTANVSIPRGGLNVPSRA